MRSRLTTETAVSAHRGWVFYDAECGLCTRGAARYVRWFGQRGFAWVPLQTPGTAERLGVTETALRETMHVQLPDGAVLRGVAAWGALLRAVGWLRPLALLLSLPLVRPAAERAYAWIAARRHRFGAPCPLPSPSSKKP
jgi:predicted DCC family thiol-disulfide oxidoreductase YuxK